MTLKEKLDKKDICIQSNPIQSNNLCILIGNSYFPPRFNISQRNFCHKRSKLISTFNQHFRSFLIKEAIKKFFQQNFVSQKYDPCTENEVFKRCL